MSEAPKRVALLARPGPACDNLQSALRQAGADLVLVADPTAGDPAAVVAASPQAVLVALEPSVEDALEKMQYDLYYVKHMSLMFDFMIALETVKTVVLRRGAK